MKAKTKKIVDPKFAMNSLLLRRRFSAGKNASLVFAEFSPFNSFQKENYKASLQRLSERKLYSSFFAKTFCVPSPLYLTSVSLFSLLASESVLGNRWNENIVNFSKGLEKPPGRRWAGKRREEEAKQWRGSQSTRLPPNEGLSRWNPPGKSSQILLLLKTDLHPRVDIGAQTSSSQQKSKGWPHKPCGECQTEEWYFQICRDSMVLIWRRVSPQHERRVGLPHVVVKVDNAKTPVERATHSWKWTHILKIPPLKGFLFQIWLI